MVVDLWIWKCVVDCDPSVNSVQIDNGTSLVVLPYFGCLNLNQDWSLATADRCASVTGRNAAVMAESIDDNRSI